MEVNATINTARTKGKELMYYIIIGIASLIVLIFLPMIGSTAGLDWAIPNTVVGWIVWIAIKLIVAALNVLIFHCFIQQGKSNVKTHPDYIKAKEILAKCSKKEEIPLSPTQWTRNTYLKKGVTIFITTGLSAVALSQALLSFDWIAMLTYLFTIIMGIILGIIQMKSTEEWWTEDYLKYALYIQKKTTNISEEIHLSEEEYIKNTISILEENNVNKIN